jgi:hypothetical protein
MIHSKNVGQELSCCKLYGFLLFANDGKAVGTSWSFSKKEWRFLVGKSEGGFVLLLKVCLVHLLLLDI